MSYLVNSNVELLNERLTDWEKQTIFWTKNYKNDSLFRSLFLFSQVIESHTEVQQQ